jgi:O-antigen/teichoic acid export membrane protein
VTTPADRRNRLAGAWYVTAAVVVLNLGNYGFTIAAAHLLGPEEFGATAALMGLLLVLNVLGLGLQTTGARRITQAAPGDVPAVEAQVLALAYRAAPLLGVLCLLAVPLIDQAFRLHSWATAATVALVAAPQAAFLGQAGVLQGRRRWRAVAVLFATNGLGRLGFGLIGMAVSADTLGAMLGTAAGCVAPLLVGWWALRAEPSAPRRAEPLRSVLAELARNSQALLAFLALSNVDVLVARVTLSEHRAGLYAAGLILVKAVLFLPQFVVVLAFPSMAAGGEERREIHSRALALVALLGAAVVAGSAVLQSLAIAFVGGHEYDAVGGRLWLFALLGTVLSLLQVLVYDVVARQHHRAVIGIWVAVVAIAASAAFVDTTSQLLGWVVAVDTAVLLGLGLLTRRATAAA